MKNKALAISGVILGVPAAIFTTMEIIDRLDPDTKPVSDTIRISGKGSGL